MEAAVKSVAPAVTARVRGKQPSRFRSMLAAAVVGTASAVLTYRLLRRPVDDEADSDND
jgi:uncharacterized membrane protein